MLEALQRDFLSRLRHSATGPLGIYRANYLDTHAAALADTFCSVRALVGSGCFDQLARRYVDGHPSTSGDLNDFGDAFPEFLDRCGILPYLGDIARLDWLCMDALLAPWRRQTWLAELLAWEADAWPAARAVASGYLLHSVWPVHAIWRAAQGAPGQVVLDQGGETVLVSRTDRVWVTRLTPAQAAFAERWLDGARLDEALEAGLRSDPGFDLPTLLRLLDAAGAVAQLENCR
jgi:hypothetical protein